MKGITPVIAIILLLLITISMVGFAFVWFSRVTADTGQEIGTQAKTVTDNSQKRATIEALDSSTGTVTIRNSGTAAINVGEIAVYADGALTTGAGSWVGGITTVASGAVAQYIFNPAGCTTGTQIRVTTPGGTDLATCS